ncbi:hypothetical protein TrCOL_g9258 [Triparma columacea]|uniref:Cyclic nucleotide-binding domain-containing protein n=1 Tax=Triparma columacea TaxID=722753 RepID=A0A9W7G293_9STRA|nr:hypothetical protein TrCOL_g9258 [Triparma columacea]
MSAVKGKEKVAPAKEDDTRSASATEAAADASAHGREGGQRLTGKSGRMVRIIKSATSANLYQEQLKDVETDDNLVHLPRGGTIVNPPEESGVGAIQFGIPPETIKDSMKLGITVPTYFVILGEMFDRQAALNMAEFEFPAYFNFFCLKKRVTLICHADLESRVRAIFTETLLGPPEEDCKPEEDHDPQTTDNTAHPKFREEGYYLDGMRRNLNVDTLIQFKTFDAKSEVNLENDAGEKKIKIKFDLFTKSYRVQEIDDKCRELAKIDEKFTYKKKKGDEEADEIREKEKEEGGSAETEPFQPPKFGITILGSSHGFDPNGSATGFVVWVKGRGIMVDPPPGSSKALEKLSIPPRLIEGVILTHCHADHDAGTFQKILKEKSINLYTTTTIFNSFLRKYAAISGFGGNFLTNLFTFKPVQIGKPTEFYGALFNFYYSFHTIPCVGFEVTLDGESMVYSADTNSDSEVVEKMFAEGAIGQQRRDMLINKSPLRGDHSLIFHEAGVPPIHTPMKLLVDLPKSIKEKMFVVHVTGSQIPKDSGLRQANIFDTLDIDMLDRGVGELGSQAILNIGQLLSSIDIFPEISPEGVKKIVDSSVRKTYAKGSIISAADTHVDSFTIFTAGIAHEKVNGDTSGNLNRKYTSGDYSGEVALVDPTVKSTFVVEAYSQVHTFEIPISVIQPHLTDQSTIDMIKGYSKLQAEGVWSALSMNLVFKEFSNGQRKDFLDSLNETESFNLGDVVDLQSCGVFIVEGRVQVLLDPSSVEDEEDLSTYRGKNNRMDFIDCEVERGAFLSDINAVLNDKVTYVTCEATSDVKLRRLERTKMVNFLIKNPGLMVQLLDTRILTFDEVH